RRCPVSNGRESAHATRGLARRSGTGRPRAPSVGAAVALLGMSCVPLELDETSEVCSAEPGRTSPTGQVDPVAATIAQIQGRQHRSNFVDRTVRVTGVVTVAYDAGFYLQSLAPDADPATSEAVF